METGSGERRLLTRIRSTAVFALRHQWLDGVIVSARSIGTRTARLSEPMEPGTHSQNSTEESTPVVCFRLILIRNTQAAHFILCQMNAPDHEFHGLNLVDCLLCTGCSPNARNLVFSLNLARRTPRIHDSWHEYVIYFCKQFENDSEK